MAHDNDTLERDETTNLISSEKVDGTAVYAQDGDRIGQVHHFMVGKRNGKVEYAVLTAGGFLGLGAEYRPVPWDALAYDTGKGGYVLKFDSGRLKESPSYTDEREPPWDEDYGRSVYAYYGVPFF